MKHLFSIFLLLLFPLKSFAIVDTRKDVWEMTESIWDFGLITSCDIHPCTPLKYFAKEPHFNLKAYQKIKKGDIVWVQCRFLPQFFTQVLPKIKDPFVLVVADGDESFPSNSGLTSEEVEMLVNNENIIHIFAHNNEYLNSEKVSHIPIGMDFHTVAYKGVNGGWGEKGTPIEQEKYLKGLLKTFKPTDQRKNKAFVDFQISDTMHASFNRYLQFGEDRTSIFNRLLPTGLIDYSERVRRYALWKKKGQYAFSISPHGNGLDCHRTWEDLIFGCIVIVKTSSLDPMYEGLPVVIVKDWSEITRENMDLWLKQYGDAFTNPIYREKLTNNYWMNKIRAKAQPYK